MQESRLTGFAQHEHLGSDCSMSRTRRAWEPCASTSSTVSGRLLSQASATAVLSTASLWNSNTCTPNACVGVSKTLHNLQSQCIPLGSRVIESQLAQSRKMRTATCHTGPSSQWRASDS